MKTFVSILVIGLLAAGFTFASAKVEATKAEATVQKLVLKDGNTVSLRLPFTGSTVQNVKEALIAKSAALPAGEPLYLFLETPGGDIGAGESLIQTALSLGREVKTVNNFSASMGYITAQSLGERIITPNGVLMAHRAKVGIDGQMPGEFNTMAQFIQESIEAIEKRVSSRMSLTHKEYQELVRNEFWVSGQKAVDTKAADVVARVTCASDLQGEYDEYVQTAFGPLVVTWKSCPLLTEIVSISFAQMKFSSDLEERHITTLIRASLTNRRFTMVDLLSVLR